MCFESKTVQEGDRQTDLWGYIGTCHGESPFWTLLQIWQWWFTPGCALGEVNYHIVWCPSASEALPPYFDWNPILMLRWATPVLSQQDRQHSWLTFFLMWHCLGLRFNADQGTHVVYFITGQVTGHGAVLCHLAGLSQPMPSCVPCAATISSAGTHEAEVGDQRCKERDWVPQEFLTLELFVCYICKVFVQEARLWSVSFSLVYRELRIQESKFSVW